MIKALIFDWGDTLMKDNPEYPGPMAKWPAVELMPGVYNVLDLLSKKYICCAASNAGDSDCELMRAAFERAGINQFIHKAFTSKELGYSKPDIRFYMELLNQIKYSPEEIVMIGNDFSKDIGPAKAAGMNTIFYSTSNDSLKYKDVDYLITDMEQLPGCIKTLEYSCEFYRESNATIGPEEF